jgi:ABC-type nickel/cobalt efflux system permease component RcnA
MNNKIQLILIIVVGLLVATNIFTYTKVTALGQDIQETNSFAKASHTHATARHTHNHTHEGYVLYEEFDRFVREIGEHN